MDIAKTGEVDWENIVGIIRGIGTVTIALGVLKSNAGLLGAGFTLVGVTTALGELKKAQDEAGNIQWDKVDWVTFGIGAAETIFGIVKVAGYFKTAKTALAPPKEVAEAGKALTATIETMNTSTGQLSTKLSTFAKNLGMGLVIVAEVAAAALLITGAIILLGMELEQVGIAWQPVIDNGGTVAAAMGLGVAVLTAVGVVTALLGYVGTPLIVNIALGTAILAELGVATGLFIIEIWAIGKGLDEIGKAWQPVLDNGETIATGIGLGTALLIGIGAVTALLGAATIATGALLPIAIGLGTALLVELAAAVVLFIESLVVVAKSLGNDLAPVLKDLNGKLPGLTTDMSDFVDFMCGFAGQVGRYAAASSVAGIAATIDTIIGWFTQDPIEKMSKDVDKIAGQASDLNEKLNVAIPELKTAVDLLGQYVTFVDELGKVAVSGGTVNLSEGLKVNLKTVGENIVTGFNDGIKNKYSTIKSTSFPQSVIDEEILSLKLLIMSFAYPDHLSLLIPPFEELVNHV